MKFRYRHSLKTRIMLALIFPFQRSSPGRPTAKALQRARATLPRFFAVNWILGRIPKGLDIHDQMIPVRDAEIPVRIYRPAGATGALPLILNYHGGGWAVGNLQKNDNYCGVLAKELGAVVVSVDYRLAPEHPFPIPLHDAYDALVWASQNAELLGADLNRVCVTGDSAGGNLSAAVALMSRDLAGPAIHFQALIYPATDSRLEFESLNIHAEAPILTRSNIFHYLDMYMGKPEDRYSPYLSPYLAKSLANLPPAVVVTAGYDPLCDDGEAYAARLNAEGTPAEWIHYPTDIHGFFTLPNHTNGKAAILQVVQRIRQAFESGK
jgi:acetyl esterase